MGTKIGTLVFANNQEKLGGAQENLLLQTLEEERDC